MTGLPDEVLDPSGLGYKRDSDDLDALLAEEMKDPEFAAAYRDAEARAAERRAWEPWETGTGRCPLCIGCNAIDWYSMCDCFMAPDPPRWRWWLWKWSERLRHPIDHLQAWRFNRGLPPDLHL